MRFLVLLGLVLASLVFAPIAIADTSYDVSVGLWNNTATPTTWQGLDVIQTGVGGWYFGYKPNLGWYQYTHGSGFDWSALSSFTLMTKEYCPSGANDYARKLNAPGGAQPELANADLLGDIQPYYRTPQDPNYRGGWVQGFGMNDPTDAPVIQWIAPAAGVANVSFTVTCLHSQYATMGSEIHVGLYHGGAWTQLGWAGFVSLKSDSGAPAPVTISASGLNVSTGDQIVLVMMGYNQVNDPSPTNPAIDGMVSGGITLLGGVPGTIRGTVTSGGQPVANATVSDGGSNSTSTGTDGTYTLAIAPGTYTITASKIPGYASSQQTGVVVTSGGNTSNINFALATWGTISGTVSDVAGAVSGATVSTDASDSYHLSATTDAAGHYSLQIPAGTYTIDSSAAQHLARQNAGQVVSNGTNTPLNITLVRWGKLTGTVTGPSGAVAGATVSDGSGTYSGATASDGTYTIFIPAGTYAMTAGKPGFEPATQPGVVMANDTTTTQNFTLGLGALVSGTVADANPPYPALVGASVIGGVYSATTDSAGHYSVRVTRGNYTFAYSKAGYIGMAVAVNASNDITQNVSLTQGWDFATDLGTVNPNGVWTYGYDMGTASPLSPLSTMNYNSNPGWFFCPLYAAENLFAFAKNPGSTAVLDGGWPWGNSGRPSAWREAQKVIVSAGGYYTGQTGSERAIARFTSPVTGYYTVSARFAAADPAGTTSSVALRHNDVHPYLLGDPAASPAQLNGFVGRADNGYSDSAGPAPVYTYSQSMDLTVGDTLDAIVYGTHNGWAQVDLTVAKSSTIIKGRITSDLPGNPPVIGASVQANAGGVTYTADTDVNGNYALSLKPGDYELETFKGGYNVGTGLATVSANQTVTANITMPHKGTWDVGVDFSTLANPNGQWTYGWINQYSSNLFTPFSTLHTGELYSHEASQTSEWINNTFHQAWIGKNYGNTPAVGTGWGAASKYYYIEPYDMFIQSGDADSIASFRWTSTSSGVYDIYCRVFNQSNVVDGSGNGVAQGFMILKNGAELAKRVAQGFVGTNAAGYADSIGPSPAQVFNLTIPVNSGDVIDFAQDMDYQTHQNPTAHIWDGSWSPGHGTNAWPPISMGISITVARNTSIVQCNSVADLKTAIANQPIGTAVMMLAPVTVTSAANRYKDNSLFVESDDRSQAYKLVGDGNTAVVAEGWKITFSGTIIADPADASRKVIQVVSINSQTSGTELKPLGMTSKSVNVVGPTARDKFVRVFGIVKSLVANTGADNANWPYEYYVINDGGQDLKIKMHGQGTYMNDPTPLGAGTVGHYIAVRGIVVKDGGELLVFPRGYGSGLADLDDYYQTDNQPH